MNLIITNRYKNECWKMGHKSRYFFLNLPSELYFKREFISEIRVFQTLKHKYCDNGLYNGLFENKLAYYCLESLRLLEQLFERN